MPYTQAITARLGPTYGSWWRTESHSAPYAAPTTTAANR